MAEQPLQGKVVIVAGGATGIGAATALKLSEAGAAVVIGDINLEGGTIRARKARLARGSKARPSAFQHRPILLTQIHRCGALSHAADRMRPSPRPAATAGRELLSLTAVGFLVARRRLFSYLNG